MSENRNSFIEATKPTDEKLEALKQLYPGLFSDGKINLDVLKEITGGENPQEDRTPGYYGLYWPGKRKAKIEAKASPKGTLVPVPGDGVNEDTTHNIYIEGDNLEVLRILKQSYKGRVKMIYIDPPYNTGSDFIYPDNYKMPVEEYKKLTGQTDEKGNALTTNQKSNGAFHTNWLNMMLPRIMLARELLTEDGAIFLHIDENEDINLKMLCFEVFGEENDLGSIVWDKRNPKGVVAGVASQHETIHCFAKNITTFNTELFLKNKEHAESMLKKAETIIKQHGISDKARELFKEWVKGNHELSGGEAAYSLIDSNGKVYRQVSMAAPDKPETRSHRPLIHPITKKQCPVPAKGWRYIDSTMDELLAKGKIDFGIDENTQPTQKYYLEENKTEAVPSLIYYGGSDDAEDLAFDNPKPIYVAKRIINYLCKGSEKEICMDFFSGTATTAHACMALNFDNNPNSNIQFIMVQLPLNLDKQLNNPGVKDKTSIKKAIETLEKIGKPHTICEIGKERIRRSGKFLLNDNPMLNKIDIGFKVYKYTDSNFKEYTPVQGQDENATKSLFEELENNQIPLVDGWKTENVLTEIILKQGFALDCDCKKVDAFTKNTVYCIKDSKGPASRTTTMYVCLDSQIDSDTIKNLKLDEKEKFVCLNSAIDDTSYARLADKGRIETI